MSEISDEISLYRAMMEFGIDRDILRRAADRGIIHMRIGEADNHCVKYLLSRSEIQKNLEPIKRCKMFYKKEGNERSKMEELIRSGIRGVSELERHGISLSTIIRFYPRPTPNEKMFYCTRLNSWTPACKINDCRLKGDCHELH